MAALRIPIGTADFRELREGNFEFVDKSHLITELIDRDNYTVVLLPRPRRFGKTINLTMLKWFFEKRDENLWHLFEDLHVARAGDAYRAHFQQYPVIHISFKGTRAQTFDGCYGKILDVIQEMCKAHERALEGKLDASDASKFRALVDGSADQVLCELSLQKLTRWLHEAHGKRPIVLIDEYDAAIHAGYTYGYYDKVIGFFRSFLEAGLKDNTHLGRAVMTGILRVAKESIFSGLNNPGVFTLLESEFNTCFGFTEPELQGLLQKGGMEEYSELLRAYYNGYDFGGVAIYNPWSILEFLSRQDKRLLPYWLNTSENALIKHLLQHHAFAVEKEIRELLEGGAIDKQLDNSVVFSALETNKDALWSLLVFSGYLKASFMKPAYALEAPRHLLSIPNREVAEVYRSTFQMWLDKGLQAAGGNIDALTSALLKGDIEDFQDELHKLVAFLPSYHDVRGAKPEQFYHGLMIGLLAALEPDYEVRSNRESGEGRPDVLIKPRRPGKPGVVLELKAAKKRERTLKQALAEGLRQLRDNDYAAELRAAGVEKIHRLAIAFDGKKVLVESADKPVKKRAATLRKVGETIRKVVTKTRSSASKKSKR
ncbi:MAG: AAA family ATPase [Polyangiaceae bacterium]|nr:AAA family ATPase [Polyangiaceae bacterium]